MLAEYREWPYLSLQFTQLVVRLKLKWEQIQDENCKKFGVMIEEPELNNEFGDL
jgi:hypothetical protein